MAQESVSEALDSSISSDQSQLQSQSQSQSQSPSSSDPALSRNVSFSRLNAKAPEFVPTRPPSRTDQHPQQQQQPRLVIPPPPPPAMLHVYPPPPPPPPFHVPVHSPVGPPNHMVPLHQNHHHRHHHRGPLRNHNHNPNHHHPHHQHNHGHNHHHAHAQYHNQQYYGSGSGGVGEQEAEIAVKKGQQAHADPDHGAPARNGLSEETNQKILNQVEYYFSDLNLATTDHLMRFINKDSEGYVPISVVASFKKIKALISSHSQLATILRESSKLVVSEDGKKVRRQHPLTESDMEELQSRIVVAENLPEDHCHQNLMKIFSAPGSVKTIRTCLPQTSGSGGSSTSRSAKADGMLYSNKLHAFVEYESVELAEKAVEELNDEGNWRSGLRVRLMLKRGSKPAQTRGRKGHEGEGHHEEDDASTSEQQHEKQLGDTSHQTDVHPHEHTGEEHVNDKENGQRKGRSRGRGKGRGRGQYHQNNRGNHVGTPPSNNNTVMNEQSTVAKHPPGPRMPDGTRGFAMGRGKPVAMNIA